MELAPTLNLAGRIVDLVSSGATLTANNLVEVEHIADVTSRLVVNRTALKTYPDEIGGWVERLREVVDAA
jgi:ATP phosphoribosyltransferase